MPLNRFVNIPVIPQTGNPDLDKSLNGLKENVELLCALRGTVENNAVIKGNVTQDYPATPTAADLTNLTALQEVVRGLMVNLKT